MLMVIFLDMCMSKRCIEAPYSLSILFHKLSIISNLHKVNCEACSIDFLFFLFFLRFGNFSTQEERNSGTDDNNDAKGIEIFPGLTYEGVNNI